MLKKLLVCVSMIMVFLASVSIAGADLLYMDDGTTKDGVYIYYVPATKDNDERTTAQYAAEAISARWHDSVVNFAKYNAKNFNPSQQVFTNGNSDGTGAITSRLLPAHPETGVYDYWFIVPQEAATAFINNTELMNQCKTLLGNEQSSVHVAFIGNQPVSVTEGTALGELAETSRTDWIQVTPNFATGSLQVSSLENRDIHTGSFFVAALYGRPVDMPAAQSEDGMTWKFTMPQTGKAFVLVQWSTGAGTTVCVDASGNPCEKNDTEITIPKGTVFTGTLLPKMAEGSEYAVSCLDAAAASVHIYWYPELAAIRPQVLQSGTWRRGENTIELTVENDYGRAEDFVVQFDYRINDGSVATLSAEYNSENKLWQKSISVDTTAEIVTVSPSVRINMRDGNKIWEWQGENVVFDVLSEGVKKSSQAPDTVTVWYDPTSKLYGKAKYSWNDFFNFNPEDHPEFDVSLNTDAGEPVALVAQTEDGFTLTAAEAAAQGESCTMVLTASLPNEKAEHVVEVSRRDIAKIWQGIAITSESAGKAVSVGEKGQITVVSEMPAQIEAELKEAVEQKVTTIGADDLLLVCRYGDQQEQTAQLSENAAADGRMAELTIQISDNTQPGKASVLVEIRTPDQKSAIINQSIGFTVTNNPPVLQELDLSDREIRMDGFPWAYHKLDDFLMKVYGTNRLFDLFQDPETELVSATVRITYRQQEFFSETVHNAEDETVLEIAAPGEYEVTLTAYDGVNDSEAYTQQISVYSFVLRMVSYVIAGLSAILLILAVIMIIRQIRKPSFENLQVRAYVSSDEDQSTAAEIISKCKPVSLGHFGKNKVSLATVLLLCRQPEMAAENMAAVKDIMLLPTKHNELNIFFGKEAQKLIGRSEKKETVAQGNTFRMRAGNTYIQIENVHS